MGNSDDYNTKLDEIKSVEDNMIIKQRNIPIYVYIQEAENLHLWCQPDKANLVGIGFDWKIAEDIKVLVGALREAESRWLLHRFTKAETALKWSQMQIQSFELLKELLHHFRFAYRNNKSILNRVNALAGNQNTMAIIQNLNDLAVLGKENPTELNAIKLDLKILDQAANLADEMGAMLAVATVEGNSSSYKKIRDQAFTLLKMKVDMLCEYGQYLSWKDESRIKGYSSSYLRRARQKRKRKEEKDKEVEENEIEEADDETINNSQNVGTGEELKDDNLDKE